MELISKLREIVSLLHSLLAILLVVALAAGITFRAIVIALQQRAIRIHENRASLSRRRALAVRARQWY